MPTPNQMVRLPILLLVLVPIALMGMQGNGRSDTGPPGTQVSEEARNYDNSAEIKARIAALRAEWIHKHYQRMRRDADNALQLSEEFKAYADHSVESVLSAKMLKQLRKISDLSHNVRQGMYSHNVPRITSDENVPSGSANESAQQLNEPQKPFQAKASRCVELATHLNEVLDQYLENVNQNTVSFAPAQKSQAIDIVNTAAQLEGISYELSHK